MAKIKILKNKGTGKALATAGTTALLLFTIAGGSLFSHLRNQASRPEQTTDDNTSYSETTEKRTEADIHTVAPDDTILDEITFEDETLVEETSTDTQTSLISSIITELITEENSESVTRPNKPIIEQPEDIERLTEALTTNYEEHTVTDDAINEEPIIAPDNSNQTSSNKELNQAFSDVIIVLNNKLDEFFDKYKRKGLPTLTGYENIIVDEQNGTFTFKVEGSADSQTLMDYQLTLTNNGISGDNFIETYGGDKQLDEQDDSIEFLNNLKDVILEGEITSFKDMNLVQITNHQSAGEFILGQQNITVNPTDIQQVQIIMDLNSRNVNKTYTYTCKVNILLNDISYLGTVSVTSTTRLKTDTLEECIQKIINGETVEQTYKFDVAKISTNKIYDIIQKINDKLEEEQSLIK